MSDYIELLVTCTDRTIGIGTKHVKIDADKEHLKKHDWKVRPAHRFGKPYLLITRSDYSSGRKRQKQLIEDVMPEYDETQSWVHLNGDLWDYRRKNIKLFDPNRTLASKIGDELAGNTVFTNTDPASPKHLTAKIAEQLRVNTEADKAKAKAERLPTKEELMVHCFGSADGLSAENQNAIYQAFVEARTDMETFRTRLESAVIRNRM